MAQRIEVVLVDDIDGGNAEETLTFAFDGASYEIDLSAANAERFRQALAPFVGHARKTGRPVGRRHRTSNRTDRSAQIRAWARSQGIAVNQRGRVPADLVARFDAANPDGATTGQSAVPAATPTTSGPTPTGPLPTPFR